MKNFAYSNGYAFSMKLMNRYDKGELMFDGLKPGKVIRKFVRECMYDSNDDYIPAIVMVYHGCRRYNFAHAATFVRCLHNGERKNIKQVQLLDCKNQKEIICFGMDQLTQFEHPELDHLQDIEDKTKLFYAWDLYMIVRREVHDENERKRLDSNMKYILTGEHPDL